MKKIRHVKVVLLWNSAKAHHVKVTLSWITMDTSEILVEINDI